MAEHCYPDKLVAVIKPEAKLGRRVSPEGVVGQNERLRLAVVVDRRNVKLHCAADFSRRPIKCAEVTPALVHTPAFPTPNTYRIGSLYRSFLRIAPRAAG